MCSVGKPRTFPEFENQTVPPVAARRVARPHHQPFRATRGNAAKQNAPFLGTERGMVYSLLIPRRCVPQRDLRHGDARAVGWQIAQRRGDV